MDARRDGDLDPDRSAFCGPAGLGNRKEAVSAARWAKRQSLLGKSGDGFPIYSTCAVLPEDKIAIKYRYSAFIPYPSELDDMLRKLGIDTLLVTGVATSTCCESTAREAAMWGLPHYHGLRR